MALSNEELEERVLLLEQRNDDVDWMAANTAWVANEYLHWIVGDVYVEGWVEHTTPIIDGDLHAAILVAQGQ